MVIQILDEIAAAKGKQKIKILEENKSNILIQEFWHMAYSRMNFGTSILMPLTVGNSSVVPEYGKIVALLDKLRCRVVTGNAAKQLIMDTITGLHPHCIEMYNRVIKSNLKCGIGFSAGQKVFGKDLFHKYPVMLISAHCNKKAAKIIDTGCAIMQLKGDGVRGITECDKNSIKYFSRQGEVYQGLNNKFDSQLLSLKQAIYEGEDTDSQLDFDGEFCVIENGVHMPSKASGILNKCIEGTATKEDIDQLTYMVWDAIERDGDEYEEEIYAYRLQSLKMAIANCKPESIILADTWGVKNLDEVHAKYAEIVKTGNEGVVLKSGNNVWKDTRVSDCIKYKEKHRFEAKIISWYYGEAGKEFQNVIGGYHIESACGLVLSKTGSGLSFEDRGVLMDTSGKKPKACMGTDGYYLLDPDFDFEKWIDGIVSIEYNRRTKSKDGRETYSLRFPIVKQFRLDKDTANTMEEMILEEESSYGLRT